MDARKFYTTGYEGKDVTDLPVLLETLDAVLVDIRFSPHSRQIVWTRNYLKLLLTNRYRHVAALGNRHFRKGKVQIQNLTIGMKIVRELETDAVLMCGCADLYQCHRLIVLNELRRSGFEVKEINTWKIDGPSLF